MERDTFPKEQHQTFIVLSFGSSSPFYIGIFHKYVQATHLFRSIDVNPIYD